MWFRRNGLEAFHQHLTYSLCLSLQRQGTGGIGAEIVVELAKHDPARILFTGRNTKSAETIIQRIKSGVSDLVVSFVACDFLASSNGGIMANPAGLSADWCEIYFATNHPGHALPTRKLLPLLERTADLPYSDVRLIYTASLGWHNGTLDFENLKTPMESAILGRGVRHGNSKLANMLYALEVARRHPKVLTFSLHPGVVKTVLDSPHKLSGRLVVQLSKMGNIVKPKQETYSHLWAVSAPRNTIKQGGFYGLVGIFSPDEAAAITKDEKFANGPWEYTEKSLEYWV